MLKNCLILFFLCSARFLASAQDMQQQYLKYYFSEELGYQVDSISNPELYSTVVEWLSTHYRYGGKTRKGIDCSSFVSVVYNNAYNLSLSGSSGRMYSDDVIAVGKEDLKEGDLIFFKIRKKRISHVGVYLGKNKFAHATRMAGVIVSDLDDPYYRKYYFSGGRHKSLSSLYSSHAIAPDPCTEQHSD